MNLRKSADITNFNTCKAKKNLNVCRTEEDTIQFILKYKISLKCCNIFHLFKGHYQIPQPITVLYRKYQPLHQDL